MRYPRRAGGRVSLNGRVGLLLIADGDDLRVTAINEKDWALAWQHGIEPIRQVSLEGMRKDLWNIDPSVGEGSRTFGAALIS